MRCSRVRRLLVTEEGAIYGDVRSEVARLHLARCAVCREELVLQRAEVGLLSVAWRDLGIRGDFTEGVMSRLTQP